MRETVPRAVQECHDLLRRLIPHPDKFPRARRFTLGERLEGGLLDAAYRRDKTPALRRANRRLHVVRHLRRLSYQLEVVPANGNRSHPWTRRFRAHAGDLGQTAFQPTSATEGSLKSEHAFIGSPNRPAHHRCVPGLNFGPGGR